MPPPRPYPGAHLTQPNIRWATITDGEVRPLNGSDMALTGTLDVAGATSVADLSVSGDLAHTGSNVGFYSATPTSQQAALTTQDSTVSLTATQTTPWGFASEANFDTLVAAVANLQTRVQELEDALQAYGLLA